MVGANMIASNQNSYFSGTKIQIYLKQSNDFNPN